MYQQLTALCLRNTRHNDSRSILSLWTAEAGRIAVAIPAGNGRSAVRIKALTLPLSLIEAQIDIRSDRDIFNISDIRPLSSPAMFSSSPAKTLAAMFMTDFLETCLRNASPDLLLSRFVFQAVSSLQQLSDKEAVNFCIYFLIRFSRFVGIEPDWGQEGSIFDLADGCFRQVPPLHSRYLDETDTAILRQLGRITARNMHRYKFTRAERSRILHTILDYYSIHYMNLRNLPSTGIISQI